MPKAQIGRLDFLATVYFSHQSAFRFSKPEFYSIAWHAWQHRNPNDSLGNLRLMTAFCGNLATRILNPNRKPAPTASLRENL
jgi:hypothetical protein